MRTSVGPRVLIQARAVNMSRTPSTIDPSSQEGNELIESLIKNNQDDHKLTREARINVQNEMGRIDLPLNPKDEYSFANLSR